MIRRFPWFGILCFVCGVAGMSNASAQAPNQETTAQTIRANIQALKHPERFSPPDSVSIEALEKIGAPAVPALIDFLKDKNSNSIARASGAEALGNIGAPAAASVPALIDFLKDKNNESFALATSASALVKIAARIEGKAETLPLETLEKNTIPDLEKALAVVAALPQGDDTFSTTTDSLRRSVTAIKLIAEKRRGSWGQQAADFLKRYPAVVGAGAYVVGCLSVCGLLLWVRPLALVGINDALRPFTAPLPAWLGGDKVSLRTITFVGFFNYTPRVLDAWVEQYLPEARTRFDLRTTVRDRAVYVPIPVSQDDAPVPELTARNLGEAFAKDRVAVLIWGEGGAGKTSIACQIARWGMAENPESRLCTHPLLPVLLEDELTTGDVGKRCFEAVRGQLTDLIGATLPVPEELLTQLLRRKRVLVLVDHFSEMSDATRAEIPIGKPDFPVNALVVTSRLDERLGGVIRTVLKPRRIEGDRLSWFMDAYLTRRKKRDLFKDPEYFDGCRKLSLLVGEERSVTVLLAKLYAEQMISIKEGEVEATLPDNVPDLMLRYVNELNRTLGATRRPDRDVQADAQMVAYQCLRKTFRPTPALRSDVLAALGADAESRLVYLEDRLRLVQTVGEGRDRIRFALDPLAEYLAGLYLLTQFGAQEDAWRKIGEQIQEKAKAAEPIDGFRLALRDCCLAKGADTKAPPWAADALNPTVPRKTEAEQTEVRVPLPTV